MISYMRFRTFLMVLCFISVSLYSQNNLIHNCSSSNYLIKQEIMNPGLKAKIENMSSQIVFNASSNSRLKSSGNAIIIPVVVHILYNTPDQNVTNAQVYSQIDVLNEDFRRLNNDASKTPAFFLPFAADCEIEFCLAQQDPLGNPTSGIIRKYTNEISFSDDDGVKHSSSGGVDIWDRNRYLNIWVCNLGGGIEAGYSSFPGFPADRDGIVILNKVFGRTDNHNRFYNSGRTVTHEVGHWLFLYHLWGNNGSDYCPDSLCNCSDDCNDTPTQKAAHYRCPVYPSPSCSDTSDIFMDYMDYTDDDCMNVFTLGQKNRMHYALNTFRDSIETSNACLSPLINLPEVDFTADKTEIPEGRFVNFSSSSSQNISHYLWIFNGAVPDTSNQPNPQNIWYSKPGKYTVTMVATNSNGNVKVSKIQYITVDTVGHNNQIKINYQYVNRKKDSLCYYYNYNTLAIDFGKFDFYNIKIKLYNLLGQTIAAFDGPGEFAVGSHKIVLPIALTNDVYILSIQTQDGYINKKLMILH